MYIGSTGARGLHHMIWEIVDNAIDEAANGYATEVSVTLYKDGSCEVTDNGRGIPVGIHPKLGGFRGGSGVHPAARGRQNSTTKIMPIPAACTAWAPAW